MHTHFFLAVIFFIIGLRIGTSYIYKTTDKKPYIGIIIIFISILVAIITLFLGKWYDSLNTYYEPID